MSSIDAGSQSNKTIIKLLKSQRPYNDSLLHSRPIIITYSMCEEVTFIETYCLPKANEEIHIRSPVTTTNIRSIFEPENSRILSNAFHIHTAAYRGI